MKTGQIMQSTDVKQLILLSRDRNCHDSHCRHTIRKTVTVKSLSLSSLPCFIVCRHRLTGGARIL